MKIDQALFYFVLQILSIIILACYSMMEMAAVSFSPVRLQYYASKGKKEAIWLNELLKNSEKLFGTTLILVNLALMSGSEFSRQFHEALGINPDFSPFSQVFLVLIFGELAPMFAARRYPEQVALLLTPLIYFSSKIISPFLYFLGLITRSCNRLFGGKASEQTFYLTQEELLKILEPQNPSNHENKNEETIATKVFYLEKKLAKDIMNLICEDDFFSFNGTVKEAKKQFKKTKESCLIVNRHGRKNRLTPFFGLLFPRNLLRVDDDHKIKEYLEDPWFVTESTKAVELLHQFRINRQKVALVLNAKGAISGIIYLRDLVSLF